jgi:hypothetical protein
MWITLCCYHSLQFPTRIRLSGNLILFPAPHRLYLLFLFVAKKAFHKIEFSSKIVAHKAEFESYH